MTHPDQHQTLVEHLSELRYRLIMIVLGVAVGAGVSLYFSELILDVIRAPIKPFLGEGGALVYTKPMDPFMIRVKVGLLGGIVGTCPYWVFHLWRFIAPGLYDHERKYAGAFIVSGSLLFLIGVAFVYFFVYPMAFDYLFNLGGGEDKPMITINEYVGFFAMTTVMFGVAFELPLVLVLLALMGLIDADFLARQRRYAIVVLAVVSALLTPPDIVSMTMMLVPLYLMYEISIVVIRYLLGRRESAV